MRESICLCDSVPIVLLDKCELDHLHGTVIGEQSLKAKDPGFLRAEGSHGYLPLVLKCRPAVIVLRLDQVVAIDGDFAWPLGNCRNGGVKYMGAMVKPHSNTHTLLLSVIFVRVGIVRIC